MMRQVFAGMICAALAVGFVAGEARGTVSSTFDTDTDGWFKLPGSDAGSSVSWVSTGGNPGGYMQYNEVGSGFVDYAAAPAKFLGNKSSYYGGTLSFDILTNTLSNPTNRDDQVKLIGNGLELTFQLLSPSPTGQWHARSVDLLETAGWVNTADSQAPSMAEMLGVLGDLTALQLLTDYRNGAEAPSYDNVILSGPALTGDLDADGFVGIADLNIVLGNWNQTVPPADPRADPSGDDFVGIADLNTVLGNWNAGTPPAESSNIPEPGTMAIIGIGLSALLRRRGGR